MMMQTVNETQSLKNSNQHYYPFFCTLQHLEIEHKTSKPEFQQKVAKGFPLDRLGI